MALFCDNCLDKMEKGVKPPANCPECSTPRYVCACGATFPDIPAKIEHMRTCLIIRRERKVS